MQPSNLSQICRVTASYCLKPGDGVEVFSTPSTRERLELLCKESGTNICSFRRLLQHDHPCVLSRGGDVDCAATLCLCKLHSFHPPTKLAGSVRTSLQHNSWIVAVGNLARYSCNTHADMHVHKWFQSTHHAFAHHHAGKTLLLPSTLGQATVVLLLQKLAEVRYSADAGTLAVCLAANIDLPGSTAFPVSLVNPAPL